MKIRIKLAINTEGNWCAMGWQGMGDQDANDTIYESVHQEGSLMEYWIEADVPVPGIPVIEATVTLSNVESSKHD